MDERSERIAKNEALFRTVNEQIEDLNRGVAGAGDGTLHIICECGDIECSAQLVVPVERYEATRADGAQFLVAPGHELPSEEDVVQSTDGFEVVRKRPGRPEQVAQATDPR